MGSIHGRKIGRAALLALVAALALALLGCGEDEEEPSTGAATTAEEQSAATDDDHAQDRQDGDDGKEGDDEGDDEGDENDDVSESGRDRSIQNFGEPASAEESRAMTEAVTSYFGALADRDPVAACEWVAEDAIEELEMFFEQARENADGDDETAQVPPEGRACQVFLRNAARAFSQKSAPKFDRIEFLRFRVEDERGFAIYKLPPRGKLFMATALDDDGWRVAAIDGSRLP